MQRLARSPRGAGWRSLTVSTDRAVVRRLLRASRAGSLACIAWGLVMLAGRALGAPRMQPFFETITALEFVLAGTSLWLRHRPEPTSGPWSRALGAVTLALGAFVLLGDVLARTPRFELSVLHANLEPFGAPSDSVSLVLADFVLIGGSLLFFEAGPRIRGSRPAEWLTLLAGFSTLLSLLGFFYGAPHFLAPFASHAPLVAMAVLIGGLLCARPEVGLMRIVSSDSSAGALARRLLPSALLLPAVVGWLRLQGELAGWYDSRFGLALFAAANTFGFGALSLWSAIALLGSDESRKKAEAAARRREEDLRITLQSIGDAVIATDASGRVVRMNPVAERLTGWGAAAATGKQLSEVFRILDERSREPVESPVHRILREGSLVGLANHTVLVAGDGTERPIADSGAPIRDDEGRTRGVVVVFRDQTEERRAEQALRESEQRASRLVQSGVVGIVISDPEGNIHEANDAFLSIVGYSRDDLRDGAVSGRTLNTPERDRTDAVARRQLATQGIAQPWEKELFRKDGSRVAVLTGVATLDPTRGEHVAFVVDLSDRKRAEVALRASEERWRLASQIAQVGAFEWNIQTGENAWTPALESMYGLQHGDFGKTQRSWEALVHPEDRAAAVARVQEAFRSLSAVEGEWRVVHPDGSVRWLVGRFQILRDERGNPQRLVGVNVDITARKRMEEEARALNENLERLVEERTAELTAANQELESFSYSVAHDLRAPLRGIRGFSALLVEEVGDKLGDEATLHLSRIQMAADRMSQLIDALLALARLSRAEPRLQAVDLSALAHGAIEQLRAHEPQREVETVVAKDVIAQGDLQLLRAVLENLLGNAWKFTRHQARSRIEFGCDDFEGIATFFVRDNGAGFDMAHADQLFAPFRRLHAPSEFEGTGIGLATVDRIVRRHGGRVWAEAAVGKGATFRFTLGA